MKGRKSFAQRLKTSIIEAGESLPLQPILELCGNRRIWIENHHGVKEYSLDRITIAVEFGKITISGDGLCLRHMQGKILSITGEIDCITVTKG